MKVLLIASAVAIVVFCVVAFVFYVGVMMGSAGVMAIVEDALEKELISDFEVYTEKIESYNPNNVDARRLLKENIKLLLENESFVKFLVIVIRLAIFRR